jgi:hypothetical protein
MTITIILLIAGLVCFLVAAVIGWAATGDGGGIGRTNFLALGLAFWITTQIIAVIPAS